MSPYTPDSAGNRSLPSILTDETLRRFAEYVVGLTIACVVTYGAFELHFTTSAISCLYLLMVVLAALRWGVWEATAASVAAFLFLDYFFMSPLFSLRVEGSENWIELFAFEFVGLVVSGLSARARTQARIATEERNNMTRLYELSRCVLLLDQREPPGPQIVQFIQRAIGTSCVALFDPSIARTDITGEACPEVRDLARTAWVGDADTGSGHDRAWSRVLRIGTKSIGALALCGPSLNPRVVDATSSIAAVALERSRTLENEARAEAARQSDQLRTAVLDALAHAFKTPLTAIRAASSGLLEANTLQPPEAELIALIDEESAHLSDLATRLLQTARIEKAEMSIRREHCRISTLIDDVLSRFPAESTNHRVRVDLPGPAPRISANGELIVVALVQILDNALKYSTPGSLVKIAATHNSNEVVVSVHNQGPPIRIADRERIFERFYRAPGTQHLVPGTGLGLSIARKIAEAHRGRTGVRSDDHGGTTFYLALPAVPEDLPVPGGL